jgi:soluble lytic murein transglycosylase-like protein
MIAIRLMAHPREALAALTLAAFLGAGASPATAQKSVDIRATDQSAALPYATRARPQLPQPVPAGEALRLRRAFEAQARGDLTAAAAEIERLEDRRLLGHLLADRLIRQGTAAAIADIQSWLTDFADHPDAPALHEALVARLPPSAAPAPPFQPDLPNPLLAGPGGEVPAEERVPAGAQPVRNPALDRTVQQRLAEGRIEAAVTLINRSSGMTPAYAAQLRAEMAQALFRQGQDEASLRLAQEALRLAPDNPNAAFQAGLSAFSLERYEGAMAAFERAARSDGASPALRAAAAFWTARAAVRARRPQQYVPWMLQAAQEPRTFYGMIARRSLGLPPGLVWERDMAADSHAQHLAETAGGWRALALLQIGQRERAEAELRLLYRRARNNPLVVQGIAAVAQSAGLAGLTATLASAGDEARARDTARFPLPTLMPPSGFRMDPALLYALALQESRFDAAAVSRAGARGLLQIMPATASYVANDPSLRVNAARLNDPGVSLEIGQRYVHYLARHEAVQGDLIRLLAAYNAGPGNLSRWLPAQQHRKDPLLFIESIPVTETRSFVQRVLTFKWIYASRLGLPQRSLDQIAGGGFPHFASPEEVTAMLRTRTGGAN